MRAAYVGDEMADKEGYQSIVGSLLQMAQCVRPEISLPVEALAAYCSALIAVHFAAMLSIARYVGSTASRGITFGHTAVPVEVLPLNKALDEMSLLCSDFPVEGPVTFLCDNQAACVPVQGPQGG